jgi:hypothetical protein
MAHNLILAQLQKSDRFFLIKKNAIAVIYYLVSPFLKLELDKEISNRSNIAQGG